MYLSRGINGLARVCRPENPIPPLTYGLNAQRADGPETSKTRRLEEAGGVNAIIGLLSLPSRIREVAGSRRPACGALAETLTLTLCTDHSVVWSVR